MLCIIRTISLLNGLSALGQGRDQCSCFCCILDETKTVKVRKQMM